MTPAPMKEGAALPDVWLLFRTDCWELWTPEAHKTEVEARNLAQIMSMGSAAIRYIPASDLAELTERLERAMALLKRWERYYIGFGNEGDSPQLNRDTRAFLAALNAEPKP